MGKRVGGVVAGLVYWVPLFLGGLAPGPILTYAGKIGVNKSDNTR